MLLERYSYTCGTVEPIPKHTHAEYQFALCLDWQGEYYYRGAWHHLPEGSLSIIHPGEVHAPSEKTYVPAPATYLMMNAASDRLQAVATEVVGKTTNLPFFESLSICDSELTDAYLQFYQLATQPGVELERDSVLLLLLAQLIARYAGNLAIAPLKRSRPEVMRARDFLRDNYTQNISLEQLANITQLSRFHLCRVFSKEIGVPPHVYQMQLRIDRAKQLLNQGAKIAEVASQIGFYDQSHFGMYFRRFVGVTPSQYMFVG
ncbi:MAG: helix-turn-helix domain-containing protein [Chroococcidiopsis sp.]